MESNLKRIEDFITYITPKIDKNEDNYTTDIFKTVMTKAISEIIENHNTNGLPIWYVKKLVNSLLSTFTKKQLQN